MIPILVDDFTNNNNKPFDIGSSIRSFSIDSN